MYMLYYIWSGPAFFGIFFSGIFFKQKAQISCAADQHLCFSYMNSTIPHFLNPFLFSASRAKNEVCYSYLLYFKLYFFLLFIVFSVKGGDFIQRKIDYSKYPFDPVQRNNLQLLGRTIVKKIMYQTLKTRH